MLHFKFYSTLHVTTRDYSTLERTRVVITPISSRLYRQSQSFEQILGNLDADCYSNYCEGYESTEGKGEWAGGEGESGLEGRERVGCRGGREWAGGEVG